MATLAPRNPEEMMAEDLSALRAYAERVVVRGDALSPHEEDDREIRFREFAEIGDSFQMTEREMVNMLFDGLFHKGPKCWCAECRHHAA
jgi:hypothetical protein